LCCCLAVVPQAARAVPRSNGSTLPNATGPASPGGVTGRARSRRDGLNWNLTGPGGGSFAGTTFLPGSGAVQTVNRLGARGQIDTVSGLGIPNPSCDKLDEIPDKATKTSCEVTGTPEGFYPASNYGFDVWVETGLFHPKGDAIKVFLMLLNGVWLGLIYVLKLVLALLGLAFGLNPFSEDETMREVGNAISKLYSRITDPWLSTLIVAGGIWFAYKGLIRREVGASASGTLAAIALLVLGIWIVHQPRASVGQLASMSDDIALEIVSAPQSGSLEKPTGSFAVAMARAWARMVEVPFAGLNFSDVRWAMRPPPKEAVQRADLRFCLDVGSFKAMMVALANLREITACVRAAHRRFGEPRRIIDLYLRSSPNSPPRKALWDYFNDDEDTKPKVATQGGDGALTRLSMVALFALGLIGGVLLLAWLAVRLFMQAAIAFIMLLLAPFALFFPMLGEAGRRAFKTWGLTLFGAVVAKIIYAAFLSAVLAGISVFGQAGDLIGSSTGFLLSCAFTWAVFLKRAELVGWMSLEGSRGGGFSTDKIVGLMLARRLSRIPGSVGRGVGDGVKQVGRRAIQRNAMGVEATRATASGTLGISAQRLADSRYEDAQRTVRAYEDAPEDSEKNQGRGSSANDTRRVPDASRKRGAGRASPQPHDKRDKAEPGREQRPAEKPSADRYEKAKALIARADRNERAYGKRWTDRDLKRFSEEDQALLSSGEDLAAHAHRIGSTPEAFRGMEDAKREEAKEAIERAIKRDKQRLKVASNLPGRVVGRPGQASERFRQLNEGQRGTRREHLKNLRRDRRAADRAARHRRNLSRGS